MNPKFDMEWALKICNHVCHPFSDVDDAQVAEAMGMFAQALDRIESLEDYIVTRWAFADIADHEEDCILLESCVLDCEEDFEKCPELEKFKTRSRERLRIEGLL